MKVSIIVPVFRSLQFVGDCLDSLEAQKDKDFEVILVGDHVESFQELEQVAIDRKERLEIKAIELKEGTGVAAARNLGMAHARGEYVYFLDDDDYLNSNAIAIFTAGIEGRKFEEQELTDAVESAEVFADKAEHIYLVEEANADVITAKKKSVRVGRDTYLAGISKEEQDDDENDSVEEESDAKLAYHKLLTECYQELEGHKGVEAYRNLAEVALLRSTKKMARVSVLNTVFRLAFLKENHIYFDENYRYYSDVIFMTEVMSKLETFKTLDALVYYKRIHNDTINSPALSQKKDESRFDEFIKAYKKAREIAGSKTAIEYLDRQFADYYVSKFAVSMKRKEDSSWRTNRFAAVQELLNNISEDSIKDMSSYGKSVVKAGKSGNTDAVIRKVKFNLAKRQLRKVLNKKSQRCKAFYNHVYYKKPVKENYVIFESFFGKSYTDSPKYIYEYLQKNYPGKYKCIWVIDDDKAEIPYDHVKVKRFSVRYAYYMAVSKYIVFNMRQPLWIKLKKDQTLLETWHGIPIKRLVFDQDEVTGPNIKYKEQVYKGTRDWTYLISPNSYSTEIFKSCFMFENEIIETGYPRNDILYHKDSNLIKSIKQRIGIPEGKKVILYAPTFRDNEFYKPGEYKYKCALDFSQLREQIGEEYVLLMRTHYLIADAVDVTGLEDFIINVCKYPDIAELYLVSDIMISDYSSVAFDYANLRRPMIYYTYDLEDYRDNLRGFYIDIEKELPGPLVYTTQEVADAIKNIDQISEQYKERYDAFYDKYCHLEDGHSTERVVKQVFGK